MIDSWKRREITPLVSHGTISELLAVLHYPKFSLHSGEIKEILVNDILPYCRVISKVRPLEINLKDKADEKILECAVSGGAQFLITGDKELLSLINYRGVRIVPPAVFLVSSSLSTGHPIDNLPVLL